MMIKRRVLGKYITIIFGFIILLLFLGAGIDSITYVPSNAFVVIDTEAMIYHCPPYEHYLYEKHGELLKARYNEVQEDYSLCSECKNEGCFYQINRSLTGSLLENIGILPEKQNVWNEDGTWN